VKKLAALSLILSLSFFSLMTGTAAPQQSTGVSGQAPSSAPSYVLPSIKRDALLNGLQLIALEQPETGSVTARLRINSGATFDLAGKGGLADLTAGMLLKGGGGLSAAEVVETVNRLGLTVNVTVDWDKTDITVSGPADALEDIVDLLGRVVIAPAFDQKEMDALKAARINEIKAEIKNDAEAATHKALEAVYGSHPFGRSHRGAVESLTQITRADVLSFHRRFYLANNSELLVAGDATAENLTKLARSKLGAWKKGEKAPWSFRPPEAHQSRRVIIIDRADEQQSFAVIAQGGISRRAQDYFAAAVLAEALAASNARTARQASATSIETRAEARYLSGPLLVRIKSTPSEITAMVEAVLKNMEQLRTAHAPLDQIEHAKSQVVSSISERLRKSDETAQLILDVELYGLGRDYLITFGDRISAVSAADVLRAAQGFLAPQSVAIVVAGPATKLEGELKKLGPVTVAR
jgi:zinc protease